MGVLQKLNARVFGAAAGTGGNPVTIFMGSALSSSTLEQSLVKSCEWESVFVDTTNSHNNNTITSPDNNAAIPRLRFFAPSGAQLSFCAHAAMGAAYAIHHQLLPRNDHPSSKTSTISFQTSSDDSDDVSYHRHTAHIYQDEDTVILDMDKIPYSESRLPMVNAESLVDQVGLGMMHISRLPMTVSLAGRAKTMIQVPLSVLQHKTRNPPIAKQFENNCLMAQNSSGLYLFATHPRHHDDGDDHNDDSKTEADDNRPTTTTTTTTNLECRQFPSASGYAEDPATGIAAAALAVHLNRHGVYVPSSGIWHFHQGTAMGRPSIITIQNIIQHPPSRSDDDDRASSTTTTVSLQCGGRVEIDSQEQIRV